MAGAADLWGALNIGGDGGGGPIPWTFTLMVVAILAVGFLGIVFWMWYSKYTYKLTILEQRGRSYRKFTDMAAMKVDGKVEFLQLMKRRIRVPMPSKDSIVPMGKFDSIMMVKDSAGDFKPLSIVTTTLELEKHLERGVENFLIPEDIEMKRWAELSHKETEANFGGQGFWDRYGSYILLSGTAAVCFLIFFFAFKEAGEVAKAFPQCVQAVKEICGK